MTGGLMDCGAVQGTTVEFTDAWMRERNVDEFDMLESWPGIVVSHDKPRYATIVEFRGIPQITVLEA